MLKEAVECIAENDVVRPNKIYKSVEEHVKAFENLFKVEVLKGFDNRGR